MSLPWLAARYVWIVVLREALRSPRWSAEEKRAAILVLGLAASVPTLTSFAVWVLTGRRFLGWWFRPWEAFVDPFPRLPPSVFEDAR